MTDAVTTRTTLTTDGASMFLAWLETGDERTLERLMEHPGYRAVAEHSSTWSSTIGVAEVKDALAGRPSPMYGLNEVKANTEAIRAAIGYIEESRGAIIALVEDSLSRLFPPDLAYPVELHCIVGYDWGIGLSGRVTVNLNSRLYLDNHREIGYMLVHEAAHVAYERAHGAMSPGWMHQPGGFRRLVHTLIQNEGLAVYSPLQARIEGDCLENQDYRFLMDPSALREKTYALKDLLLGLPQDYPGDDAAGVVLDRLSKERLSYVVGCSGFQYLESGRRG